MSSDSCKSKSDTMDAAFDRNCLYISIESKFVFEFSEFGTTDTQHYETSNDYTHISSLIIMCSLYITDVPSPLSNLRSEYTK